MLLQHPWLASLSKPAAISEEDGEDDNGSPSISPADAATNGTAPAAAAADASDPAYDPAYDDEVAQWVKTALERKASGQMGMSAKPALHAAPLDSVSPPAV
ncbi:hypothetical protein V498_10346 [Pseudogymnoascus sp. VKM F-4517 (FW-2822)]|nr:hypothetical protein V498_10346 [Pseudogymnoascus sp. VKM F-4517 (FW-2822)]